MLGKSKVSLLNVVVDEDGEDILSKSLLSSVYVEEKDSSASGNKSLVGDCTCKVSFTKGSKSSKSIVAYKDYMLLTEEQKKLVCCLIKGSYFCVGDINVPSSVNEMKNSTNNIYQLTGIDSYKDGSMLDYFELYGK